MERLIKFYSHVDSTANDSDKSFTAKSIGAGDNDMEVMFGEVEFTSTGTAGNRLLTIAVNDPDGTEVFQTHAGSFQAANLTYHYHLLQGIYRETISSVAETGVDGTIQVPIPRNFVIPRGYTLRIVDDEAVDAAADDMTVKLMLRIFGR